MDPAIDSTSRPNGPDQGPPAQAGKTTKENPPIPDIHDAQILEEHPDTVRGCTAMRLDITRTEIKKLTPEQIVELVYKLQLRQAELKVTNQDLLEIEARLAHARDQYTELYEDAPIPYLTLAKQYTILRANKAAIACFARAQNIMEGKNFLDLAVPEERDACYGYLRSIKPGATSSVVIRFLRENGEVFWGQLHTYCIKSPEPGSSEYRVALIDVSHQKKIENELLSSEERYRFLYEESPSVNIVLGQDSTILDLNKQGLKSLGYKKEEVLGQPLTNFVVPSQRRYLDEQLRAGVQGAVLPGLELLLYAKDGSLRKFLTVPGKSSQYNGEKTYGYVCCALDITERTRAEEALKETDENLKMAQRLSKIGSWKWVMNSDAMQWSEELCQIAGHNPLLSAPKFAELSSFYTPESWKRLGEAIAETLHSGKPHELDLEMVRPDHTSINVTCRGEADYDNNGAIKGLHGTIQDITERKRLEEALRRNSEELSIANQELEAFSYSVAHDLRNPLHVIASCVSVLSDEFMANLGELEQAALRRINPAVDQMANVISNLLMLSKISRQQVVRKPIELSAILRTTFNTLQAADPGRDVTLDIKSECIIEADPGLCQILVENLMENAWKYTSKRVAARIEFGIIEGSVPSICYLRDNGAGFDMAQAPQLFKPFQRLHSEKEFSGSGIGLATVKRIVDKHGGSVWVEAEPEKGATFYFSLAGRS